MILFHYRLVELQRSSHLDTRATKLEPIAVLASEGMLGTLPPVTLMDIFPFFQDEVELSS